MTTTKPPTTVAQSSADELVQCGHCGRYGWHTTERCPDVAPPAGATPDIWEDNQRVVAGINRGIDGHDVLVWTDHGAVRRRFSAGARPGPRRTRPRRRHDIRSGSRARCRVDRRCRRD